MDENGWDLEREISRRSLLRSAAAGGVLLGAGGLLAACGDDDAGSAAGTNNTASGALTESPAGTPQRGGVLRVGVQSGGSSDSIDAQVYYGASDGTRLNQLYDALTNFSRDGTEVENLLAESIEPNSTGDVWTIRIKDGVEFHNGKTLDAGDIKFTFERMGQSVVGNSTIFAREVQGYRVMDPRTVRMTLRTPNFFVPHDVANYIAGVVPVGYDPKNPVGTGPFKFESFTAGKRAVFTRFENYWQEGTPYLDELQIISFADDTSKLNAFLGGQIDLMEDVPSSAARQVRANDNFLLYTSIGAIRWTPVVMRTDVAPWKDPRVREAMRLLVDRDQMVAQVFGGDGEVANDYLLSAPLDGDPGLPQRKVDVEKAKSLLAQAGQSDLRAELVTAPFTPQAVPGMEVFAEQAKAAGVAIQVRKLDVGTFYGDQFLQRPLTSDFWSRISYYLQANNSLIPAPGTPYNETHWNDSGWKQAYAAAKAAADEGKRKQHIHDCMEIEHERGGYINWGAVGRLNAATAQVGGLEERAVEGQGSHNFRGAYLKS